MVFQVTNFFWSPKRFIVFFCIVQNGPVVMWIACIGHRGSFQWSLKSARTFSEAFWTLSLVRLISTQLFQRSRELLGTLKKNWFKVTKFVFEVQKALSFFCLVQNGPVIILVGCIGRRGSFKWSLWSANSEAFWTLSPVRLE